MTKSYYRVGWSDVQDDSSYGSSEEVFTNRDDARTLMDSIIKEHKEDGYVFDYYKVFEYLKEG